MQPPEYRQNYSNSKTLNRMNYIDRCGHDYGDPDDVQWLKEDFVDMPLTDEQMHIFNQSYNPDWDCRYYPIKHGTFHYLVRSGHWVSKFKYEKNADFERIFVKRQSFSLQSCIRSPARWNGKPVL